jgi:hypothetical protein
METMWRSMPLHAIEHAKPEARAKIIGWVTTQPRLRGPIRIFVTWHSAAIVSPLLLQLASEATNLVLGTSLHPMWMRRVSAGCPREKL